MAGGRGGCGVFDAGAVYVFTRTGDSWTQQAYLKPSNPQSGAEFGHYVALSADGNTLAVSAYWEASNATGINGNQKDESIPQAGAVYVFTRAGNAWTQQAYVKASNTGEAGTADTFGEGDQFGWSLAVGRFDNDRFDDLAVGVPGESLDGLAATGRVAVYHGRSSGLDPKIAESISEASVTGFTREAGDMFGTSLAATLTAMGVDTLFIVGFSTSGCVRASALDALQNGFVPLVVAEGCGDRDERPHEANLFDLSKKYAEVLSEAEAIALMQRS